MPARFRAVHSKSPVVRGWHIPRKRFLSVLVFMVAVLSCFLYMDYRVRPMAAIGATAIAKREATAALNHALTAEIEKDVDYSKIVRINRNRNGLVEEAHIDFAAVTALQSAATERADEALRALSNETLRLPWTQVVGGSIWTTFAPTLPVRMTMIGEAHSSVVMESKTEGVNQSVHIIYMDLTADVNVVSPFVTAPVTVQSRMPIAYLVLAGQVPKTFVGTPGNGSIQVSPSLPATDNHQ